ncbi:hypothetical protein BDY24DRAFT_383533 [Mrakia frigida]|uniref:FUN14 domain-containing protein n=1 Tax=Mrakia frigida TaxID=29902 RepID=UPI003FCC159A
MPPPLRLPLLFTPKSLLSQLPKSSLRSYWQPPANSPSFKDHPRVIHRLNGGSNLPPPRVVARTQAQEAGEGVNWGKVMGVSVGAVGLMAVWKATGRGGKKSVWCQAQVPSPPPPPPPPAAQSIVNPYELTFGAVCGICAGIFIKKGAKALAFLLGGVFGSFVSPTLVLPSPPFFFLSPNLTSTTSSHRVRPTVLLQYLSSVNILKVNWSRASSAYEKLTSTPSDVPGGKSVGLTVTKLWGWVVDFLTRDFQQRATFLGGLALGLRVG